MALDFMQPVKNAVSSFFNKDGTEMTDEEIAAAVETTTDVDYGKDMGDNFFVQLGTAAGGAFTGWYVGKKLSGDNKLWAGVAALAGAVVMHKVGTELATDIQRGNQYADQQEEKTGEKTSLKDRFKYIGTNTVRRGQVYEPDPDLDV